MYDKDNDNFEKRTRRDKIKYELCKEHNIPVLYYAEKEYVSDYFDKIYTDVNEIIEYILNTKEHS